MFGNLTAIEKLLTENELKRYKSAYCGLCRSIGHRHGLFSRASLSYDLTFLIILLSSLYDSEITAGNNGCIIHPFSRREWFCNEFTDYAADINVAMAYFKACDNWKDDRSIVSASYSSLIKTSFNEVCALYPEKMNAIGDSLDKLSEIERIGTPEPDAASACFGSIMAEILAYRNDRWNSTLRSAGMALGKFVYIMDACIDLENDVSKGSYNPFRNRCGLEDNRDYFYEILKMFMGECLEFIDRLPLVEDMGIIRNVLCCGAWNSFLRKYPLQEGTDDVSGSL